MSTRLLATLPLVALLALAYVGLWRGWRHRAARQADLPALPAVPDDAPGEPLAGPAAGVYLGSSTAGDWLDRIVARGLGRRGRAEVTVGAAGVLVDRDGEPALWLPVGSLRGVRLDRAAAGRVVETDGIVVLTWQHGQRLLESGLRLRTAAETDGVRDAVSALLPSGTGREHAA